MPERPGVDLTAIDAILDRLGADDVDLEDDLETATSPSFRGPVAPAEASSTARRMTSTTPGGSRRIWYRTGDGTRPADLPPLVEPPGYRRDRRGTWRYAASGRSVPGSRDVTIGTLWPLPVVSGLVVVAMDEVMTAPELAWCLSVGERCSARRPTGKGSVAVEALEVSFVEWEDRAHWPLTLTAPELAPGRLVGVEAAARLFGVAPSTVTADLTRGRFPSPQLRVGGRPAWSLPVLLDARRSRRGRW